jgi:hypothetical protein
MRNIKSSFIFKSLVALVGLAFIGTGPLAYEASAQRATRIDAGTTIPVRTVEEINAKDSDGEVFHGVVDQDVLTRNGRVAIPKGSDVELVVKRVGDNEVALDLDSVTINGERYGVEAEQNVLESQRKEGVGVNKRTGKYVGGGAILGAIIGGIAGGGKGAAIGAGAGAAAGAGAQVLTRGKAISVPSESLLTFRLTEPMRAGIYDGGYMNNGVHYHPVQGDSRYYDRQKPSHYSNGTGTISIGRDNNVSWNGPNDATVYVQVDNGPLKLFASGESGTQVAPWMTNGHIYTFILRDRNGNEIARDEVDRRLRRR